MAFSEGLTDDTRQGVPATETGLTDRPPADADAPTDAPDDAPDVQPPGDELGEAQWADDSDAAADEDVLPPGYEEEVKAAGPIEETLKEVIAEEEKKEEQRKFDWYILKVQSNREESIADALRRRVKADDKEQDFDEIIVPVEEVVEFKSGKKKIVKRKLYPGYIVVHMALDDETWFLVRDTQGIGDFTGAAGSPTAMLPHEVARIRPSEDTETTEEPKLEISVQVGDRVKINEGTFENFEGEVETVDVANGRVTVMINIFGRSTPVELEYWQIEAL